MLWWFTCGHDAGHTLNFDDQVAWLAPQTSKAPAAEGMCISWYKRGIDHHPGRHRRPPRAIPSNDFIASTLAGSPSAGASTTAPWPLTTTAGA